MEKEGTEPRRASAAGKRAMILDGALRETGFAGGTRAALENMLSEQGVDPGPVTIRDLSISACVGCFGCWVKTPGTCVIEDDGRKLVTDYLGSDIMVIYTPVTFGGYSSQIKRAVERMIPILLPFFTKVDGEIHHKPRYSHRPALIGIGLLPEPDDDAEGIFRELLRRNAINLYARTQSACIIYETDAPTEIACKLDSTIKEALAK